MTLIIVSNRLPFSLGTNGEVKQSSGGLVSAISGINNEIPKKWVGIAPDKVTPRKWKKLEIENKRMYKPVFIDPKLYEKYYNGISNAVLWPIFHYELSPNFEWINWEAYERVNQLIAEKINEVSKPEDIIWIHDFHLFLVPQFLRKLGNKNKIGFFLHIPFPSSELFRQIPTRKEILQGVLESDLIGFHDYAYLKHFCNSVKAILGVSSNMLNMKYNNRDVNLGVFPVSIDTEKFIKASESNEVKKIFEEIKLTKNYEYLILGIDRLDYIKGFLIKLESFRELLKNHPEFIGKVSLLQIAIPSREDVLKYNELKRNVEKLISEINGEFSQPNYTPIQYIYSSISFEKMIALYKIANVLFVSSRRDGMNLVSFEYIASKTKENPGVVILSEFTGAASVLSHAILINPWDAKGTSDKISLALKMSNDEKIKRNDQMLNYLKNYTASEWANSFINELKTRQNNAISYKSIELNESFLPKEFSIKKKLLLFIDYDGTLVPLQDTPDKAILTPDIKNIITKLIENKNIEIVVVSGRNSDFLENQFNSIDNLEMAAEHGSKFFDKNKKKWVSLLVTDNYIWYPITKKIMLDYSKRVPESFVETKEFSIAWHYRLSPTEFSEYQAKKLKEELELGLANLPVTVIMGNKVIEAKAVEANKGYFVNWYLERNKIDSEFLIIAIGDDTTDEDMFLSVQNKGLSIKVGTGNSIARYTLNSQRDVTKFLNLLNNF